MISKKTSCVITPAYYKTNFSESEKLSLKFLFRYFVKYDKYLIVPQSAKVKKEYKNNFKIKRFSNYFFRDTRSYNKLLLQKDFYEKFRNYNYLLIYQLDALVFSNQLEYWYKKGYDYIAAPWFNSIIAKLSHKKRSPTSGGNGGFSLRNVQSAIKVLDIVNRQARRSSQSKLIQKLWFILAILTGKSHGRWLKAPADNYPFNEDGFWSLEAPKYLSGYKVAPFKEALKFAFEKYPRKCFKLNNNKLPFGVHAWEKYDKKFWDKYIK